MTLTPSASRARNDGETYPVIFLLLSAESIQEKGTGKNSLPVPFSTEIIEKVKQIDPRILFQEIDSMENDFARQLLLSERDRKIFHYHKDLNLLKRLNDIQLTPPEYEAVKETLQSLNTQTLAQFLVQQTKKSIVLSRKWEENIQKTIQFYETSQARDHAIEEALGQYVIARTAAGGGWTKQSLGTEIASSLTLTVSASRARNDGQDIALLVFGGFHKERIKEILQKKGLSYLILSPRITRADGKHKDYYRKLMSMGHLPFEMPAKVTQASRAANFYERAGGG